MKSYDWLKDVSYDYGGSFIYVKFNLYDYEEKFGIKQYYWFDEYGNISSIEYFKVNNMMVTIYDYDSILIESEKEEDVNKVLEYIDKVVSL